MLRNDGKYNIYIIKHLYNDDPKNEWAGSGDCCHWIPREVINKSHDKLIYGNGIFTPFTANGKCWQQTGIHGSYVKRDAVKILDKISCWNPAHRYKICRLVIDQSTEDVVEMKYEADRNS